MTAASGGRPFEAVADETFRVPMRDGVHLATDCYLPAAVREGGCVPAVMLRGPYGRRDDISFIPALARLLLDRGWAVVAQDVRGKWDSEGEATPFAAEVADGSDTLDWIVGRPWSDGRVVAMGDSYLGYTTWAAATSGHPGLVAAITRVTSTQPGRDWFARGGILRPELFVEWGANWWTGPAIGDLVPDWSRRPLATIADAGGPAARALLDRWVQAMEADEAATLGALDPAAVGAITIPMLHVGGLFDVFLGGQLADWHAASGGPHGAGHRLVLDVTDHTFNRLAAPGVRRPDLIADPALRAARLPLELAAELRFLEAILDGQPFDGPVVSWFMGNDGWHGSATWPPGGSTTLDLFPVDVTAAFTGPEGGILAPTAEHLETHISWVHDPADPVPSLVTEWFRPLFTATDETEVEGRPDVATFTGHQLDTPLDLAGPVRLHAATHHAAGSGHLMAKLVDVFPTGFAQRIVEGAALVRGPGEAVEVTVELGDAAYRVLPGHRLRLEIAASAYPRYAIHPGTDDDWWAGDRMAPAEQRLEIGRGRTRLTLTVLPGGITTEPAHD